MPTLNWREYQQDDEIRLVGDSHAHGSRINNARDRVSRAPEARRNADEQDHIAARQSGFVLKLSAPGCNCRATSFWRQISPSHQGAKMKGSFGESYANIRFIGFLLFIAASVFCLYKIYDLNSNNEPTNHFPPSYTTKLKLVSVLNRHGDRAPSDKLPDNDPHDQIANSLWPNGLSNLTAAGRLRQFRIGLALRKRYEKSLDYNASQLLVFSSPIYRCQESVTETLRGLFDIETTVALGRRLAERYNIARGDSKKFCYKGDDLIHNETFCGQQYLNDSPKADAGGALILPSGSGFPLEYQKIKIDVKTLPTLTWKYLNDCKWRRDHPTPVDPDLLQSQAVAKLKGINKLIKLIKSRYNIDFNFTALSHWSSISNEILLARTENTIKYSEHYLDWLTTPLPEYKPLKVTLYDLWEQAAVLGYRDRIVGTANYIQHGPMLTSIIKSQMAVLGLDNSGSNSTDSRQPAPGTYSDTEMYRDKRMIIYSTHDSILQQLMMNLSLIKIEPEDFDIRFKRWHKSDDVNQFLAGYKMCKFGMSLVLELYETEMNRSHSNDSDSQGKNSTLGKRNKFHFIQAFLYNQEDSKHKSIQYKRLKLGAACQQKFKSIHQALPKSQVDSMLAKFYDPQVPWNRDLSCPFELFKEVTSAYMLEPSKLNELCVD